MVQDRAKANTYGPMETYTMANLKKTKRMEKAFLSVLMEKSTKALS